MDHPKIFSGLQEALDKGSLFHLFFFLLIADALSRIINKEKREGSYEVIMVTNSKELSHILFADDVVMMEEGTWGNLKEAE